MAEKTAINPSSVNNCHGQGATQVALEISLNGIGEFKAWRCYRQPQKPPFNGEMLGSEIGNR